MFNLCGINQTVGLGRSGSALGRFRNFHRAQFFHLEMGIIKLILQARFNEWTARNIMLAYSGSAIPC